MHPEQLSFPFRLPRVVQCADASGKYGDELHHLIWDKQRGRWEVRLTIDVGKKLVGKRIRVKLRTADAHEAMRQRDVLIVGYKKLGLTVRDRRQKRWAKKAESMARTGAEQEVAP